jgi:hypothetical protein
MKVEQSKTTVNSHRIRNTSTRCRTIDITSLDGREMKIEEKSENTIQEKNAKTK